MTTYGGGNGISYGNHYLDIRSNQQTLDVKVENSLAESNIIKCEEANASEQTAVNDSNEDAPVVDIVINNVVCSFNVRCHLNLRQIALNGANVEYKREHGMVTMKIRKPYTTASIWSSGKITCTGATSDADAKKASRKFARILQQLGFRVKFSNFRVVNVLGTCSMPFGVKISQFAEKHRHAASYEPELHPGATYKIKEIKATLKIFTTGNITITAPCVENVQLAVEHIFPLVFEFQKEKPPPKIKPERNTFSYHSNSSVKPTVMKRKSECLNNIEDNNFEDLSDDNASDLQDSDTSWE